ncbi:MAG TPA: ABC transporter permease [Solirubrobacteraceae bacterium]|jgi:peptide/nickel transport system permease protein
MTPAQPTDAPRLSRPAASTRALLRAARRDRVATACLIFLALVVLVAVFAPLLAPHSPTEVNLSGAYLGPSLEHPLGTDASGRDILSRVMFGARSSLLGPLGVIALALALGVSIALTAAWFGGWVDTGLSAVIDVLFAFPGLLLAIIAVAVFGVGLIAPMLAIGIAYTPIMARIVRSSALRERELPYIAAASVLGLPARRIVWRHLLPNVWPLIVAQTTVMFGYATIDLAAISFLGLGQQPPVSDWGLMVAEGRPAILAGHSAEALYPGIALVLVVLCVMVLGRQLGDRNAREPAGSEPGRLESARPQGAYQEPGRAGPQS